MESLDSDLPKQGTFISTQAINGYLIETVKWAKFLAITGFVAIGLMVLLFLFMMVYASQGGTFPGTQIPTSAFGIYAVIVAIYFFPVYYLYQFSVKMKQGLVSQDPNGVTVGFENLKSVFKFMGIFTIVTLSIYALIILITIGTALL